MRSDIDEAMIVSMMEWTVDRFQDALLTEELDPGLFSRQGNRAEKTAARIEQFLDLLGGAIAARTPARAKAAKKETQSVTPSPSEFRFESDLSSAATLPSTWYRDPHILALEQDRVFAKTWQLVGHTEQVRLPGDYFTCTVAEEPLVITRAEDGAIHAFYNVCRHRAARSPAARATARR